MTRRNKYGAQRTTVDGITFDSKREAHRYTRLRLLERADAIRGLELQPAFELRAEGGRQIATYRADFRYIRCDNGEEVVEDVKGVRTAVYRIKRRWVEAQYLITVTEV